MAADEGCATDVGLIINEGYEAWGVLKSVLRNGRLGINAKQCLYERVIVPTVLNWIVIRMRNAERSKVNVLEMNC